MSTNMLSIEIARREGEASDAIHAEIEEDGRLQMIRNSFGPGDWETEVTAAVAKEDKDRLLLYLLEQVYGGDTGAVEAFAAFARSKGIDVAWFRWP
ncbi:MAG: hypothetical protein ACK2UX_19130 [Anaerolineae bacterium]